jgi:UTP-glucose-1-phosphate uridylyltransferase
MPALRDTQPGGGGEAQLTDALREVIVHGGRVLAVPLPAGRRRHAIGSPKSYRAAFLECALRDRRFGGSRRACAQLLDG